MACCYCCCCFMFHNISIERGSHQLSPPWFTRVVLKVFQCWPWIIYVSDLHCQLVNVVFNRPDWHKVCKCVCEQHSLQQKLADTYAELTRLIKFQQCPVGLKVRLIKGRVHLKMKFLSTNPHPIHKTTKHTQLSPPVQTSHSLPELRWVSKRLKRFLQSTTAYTLL